MRTTLATLLLVCSSAAWAAEDTCELTLEGAVTGTGSQSGNAGSVGTDYWLSDEELRMALASAHGLAGPAADPAKARKLDELMKADPRSAVLIVSCTTADARITLMTSQGTRYKDVPMKAGKYRIQGTPRSKAGEIVAIPSVRGGNWMPDGDGELVVSEWNKKHIAGTFRVPLKDAGQKTVVKGAFDFPCRQSTTCEK